MIKSKLFAIFLIFISQSQKYKIIFQKAFEKITKHIIIDIRSKNMDYTSSKVVQRFLKYVSFDTQAIEESETFPSNPDEKLLGQYLASELATLGLINVEMDENGYVYGTLPASKGSENRPTLAFIAHMDVATDAPGSNIKTIITKENGLDIIRTDGNTLLGADDKSGIAEIVTAVEKMLNDDSLVHPEIRVVFTPDEEIGLGVSKINMSKVNAEYAYTIDGEAVGELTYECFNAAGAKITFHGISVHTGSAYGIMKNAIEMAGDFISLLPKDATPATTKDREGFIAMHNIEGTIDTAVVKLLLRDFDAAGLEDKKELVRKYAKEIETKYSPATIDVEIENSYYNMHDFICPKYEFLLDNVRKIYSEMGIKIDESPIRGGTDGAELALKGLPTPNIGTGTHDCHGRNEYISVQDLELITDFIVRLSSTFA